MITNYKGFTVVTVVFVLVVLGLLSGFIISMAAVTRETTNFAVQQNNAYFAARSGLEWGVFRVTTDLSCPSTQVLNLAQGALTGFNVTVTCSEQSFTEGSTTFKIHTITSFAERGTFGSSDYISRTLKVYATSGI